MAANTVTGQQILFKLARDVGELKAAWVTGVTDPNRFACGGLTEDSDNFYNGALMRLRGGSSIVSVSDYTGATKTFDTSAALSPTTTDGVEFCWWNADKRSQAWGAIQEAIRQSWSVFSRETIVDRSTATITLAAGTHAYALPSAVGQLLRVGIQPTNLAPIEWFEPAFGKWQVEGQEGAYTIRFQPGFQGNLGIAPAWSSRIRLIGSHGTFADAFAGQLLCLHYTGRESELTAETGSTQLPLDYFWVASAIYVEQALNDASRLDLATANVNIPQIQRKAQEALARLAKTKARPLQVANLRF